jgi:N-acyl-L-homoserine lactone synthetase
MQVIALSRRFGADVRLLSQMHRLRARIFRDRLNWNVWVSNEMEVDLYDARNPTYLVAMDGETTDVIGCVRLLPTTGPNMLANTFPTLLDGARAPSSERIVECSRFCVDTQHYPSATGKSLHKATFVLFAAMLEWGLDHGIEAIAAVTDMRMERILRRSGWPLKRLGKPHRIGKTLTLAGLLPVTETALASIRATVGLDGPVISEARPLRVAA